MNIGPFAAFIAERVRWSMEQSRKALKKRQFEPPTFGNSRATAKAGNTS